VASHFLIKFAALAEAWKKLAESPFVCWQAAETTQAIVGGVRVGYWTENNPGAQLGQDEGGHDFLIVENEDGKFIFDFWAAIYYGKKPILDMKRDAAEIRRLYGDPVKWEQRRNK
jgi:hypothetical protein